MFALQGRGARAAHQPLELWILVRIQAPLPNSREGGAYFVKQASLLASRGEPVLLPAPHFLVRAKSTRSVCEREPTLVSHRPALASGASAICHELLSQFKNRECR